MIFKQKLSKKITDIFKTGNIFLIAPSYGFKNSHINKAVKYLEKLALQPIIPENLLGEDIFSANDDNSRAASLIAALNDERAGLIWAMRGGYGAIRLIPYLEKLQFNKDKLSNKILMGFSDVCCLHQYFATRYNLPSIHCPNLLQILANQLHEESKTALENILQYHHNQSSLTSASSSPSLPSAPPALSAPSACCEDFALAAISASALNEKAEQHTKFKGSIIGGNLNLIQHTLGTSFDIRRLTKGNILLMEDVDEEPYRLDRTLAHLKLARVFDKLEAIIFGTFSFRMITENTQEKHRLIKQVITRFASENSHIPILQTAKIGHGEHNLPILMNQPHSYIQTSGSE